MLRLNYNDDKSKSSIFIKCRGFPLAIIISSIFHALFILRDSPFFNELIPLSGQPSYLEWIGILVLLYVLPTLVYIFTSPEGELPNTSGDRVSTLSLFAGATLVISFLGFIVGGCIGLVIGTLVHNI